MIQYFVPLKDIKVKLLEVHELPGETADIVTSAITDTLGNFNVSRKVVAFSADNTNANFGSTEQKMYPVYAKLKTCLGSNELLAFRRL